MGKKGKIIGGVVGAVVVLGIIGNCTDQTTQHDDKKVDSPKQTIQAPAPKQNQNTDQQDFSNWWGQMQGPFTDLQQDVSNVTSIIAEGANNSSLLTSSSFQDRVQQACDKMSRDAQTLQNIQPPSNPKIATMHSEIMQGVDQIKYVADNLPTGVDTLNINIINNCTQAFQSASQHFKNATDLLTEFKNN